ncbi:MAG: hypothetical protein ACK5ZC_12090 [Pirellulaceae bacterium]
MRIPSKRKLTTPSDVGLMRARWLLIAPFFAAIATSSWGQGVTLRPRTDASSVAAAPIAPLPVSGAMQSTPSPGPDALDAMAGGTQPPINRVAPTSHSMADRQASSPPSIPSALKKSQPAPVLGSLGPMRIIPASPPAPASAYPTDLGWSPSRPRYGMDDPEAVRRPRLIQDLSSRNALDPSYDSESTIAPTLAPESSVPMPDQGYSVRQANYQGQGAPYDNPFADSSNLPVLPGNPVLPSGAAQGPVLPGGSGAPASPVLPSNPYGPSGPVLPGNAGPVLPSTVSPSLNAGQSAVSPVMPPSGGPFGGPFARPEDRRITIGEPFVTEPPHSFDAYWMVHPANYQTGTAQATTTLTSPTGAPYTGTQMPYRVVPPTIMPNQAPQLYAWNAGGYQPLVSLGQDRYNVQLGRGIVGQPTVYVPGQSFRNFLRYLSP